MCVLQVSVCVAGDAHAYPLHCCVFLNHLSDSDFPMMLSVFSNLLSKEDDRRVIDNLCAALCRMISSNVEVIPLEQVLHTIPPPHAGTAPPSRAGVGHIEFLFLFEIITANTHSQALSKLSKYRLAYF